MEDMAGQARAAAESHVDVSSRKPKAQTENNRTSRYTNGQCVLSVPTSSMLSPRFDLSVCRALLEREGFQIPARDFEIPLRSALDEPSVRRYLFFNSALFHFIMAPIMYVVIWCAMYSTLHPYISFTDVWLLCLSVSLIAVIVTAAMVLILNHSNKEINVNVDVRLVQVNERMSPHKLLVGVADWVQNCTGTLQLFCVYWDMSSCLRSLTDTLEELSRVGENEAQKKLKKKMSHLLLSTEVMSLDPELGSQVGSLEERPLLLEPGRSTGGSQREDTKITTNYSLVPEVRLPAQAVAQQLLLTYSALYVRLLVSERLPVPSHRRHLQGRRTHCTTASLCLCQYVKTRVLRW